MFRNNINYIVKSFFRHFFNSLNQISEPEQSQKRTVSKSNYVWINVHT